MPAVTRPPVTVPGPARGIGTLIVAALIVAALVITALVAAALVVPAGRDRVGRRGCG